VGPGKRLEDGTRAALEVCVSDTVVYEKYGGTEILIDGKDYMIMAEDSILAIREPRAEKPAAKKAPAKRR
jgi:chaperonin GroES